MKLNYQGLLCSYSPWSYVLISEKVLYSAVLQGGTDNINAATQYLCACVANSVTPKSVKYNLRCRVPVV